jgi:hypothetical protein
VQTLDDEDNDGETTIPSCNNGESILLFSTNELPVLSKTETDTEGESSDIEELSLEESNSDNKLTLIILLRQWDWR